MTFQKLFKIIYIRGYFATQPKFLLEFLKASVNNPASVSISESSLNAYIQGSSIGSMAVTLKNAGFNITKLTQYIESLYNNEYNQANHKEEYSNKKYKDALFEKVKKESGDILPDNMSEFLAKEFEKLINDAISFKNRNDFTKLSFSISDDEKKEIKVLCKVIKDSLHKVKSLTDRIDKLKHEPNECTNSEASVRLLRIKEYELEQVHDKFDEEYEKLEIYCENAAKMLSSKKHLCHSLEKIYSIVTDVFNEKYKISNSEKFSYSSFSLMISNYENAYQRLLKEIDSL